MNGSQWTQGVLVTIAMLLGILVWDAASDEPPTEKSKLPVGLIDIARVFKEDRKFNGTMIQIKGRIDEFERYIRERQAELAKLTPKESSQGSGEQSEAAKKAEALSAAIAAEIAVKRQAFLAEEAAVYHERYQSIESAVREVCRERQIDLVLRFNSDKMNPADRASVLQGVNRAVVYSRVPDLTTDVVNILNDSVK